jgi:hypothetical protein
VAVFICLEIPPAVGFDQGQTRGTAGNLFYCDAGKP